MEEKEGRTSEGDSAGRDITVLGGDGGLWLKGKGAEVAYPNKW